MIKDMTTTYFLEALSSKSPTPGGGGAAALGGAIGTALGEMVGNLTIGKKKYAEVEDEVKELLHKLEDLRKQFLKLADEDAVVFTPLAAAYSLPTGTEEEKAHKEKVLEKHLLEASLVPIAVMERSMEALAILEILGEKGSTMAISDIGVGVQFIRSALLGAVMNVSINTKSMKNRKKAEELDHYAEHMVREGSAKADKIYENVANALK